MKPSGIRKFFELGRSMANPIDLSIGQPEFPVPDAIKRAAIEAIDTDKNGYTVTQGIEPLREALKERYATRFGAAEVADEEVMVTSGVSGALSIAFLALLDPGEEILIPDPYFVIYPQLATMLGAKPVPYPIYPDFKIDADRIRELITDRTRAILVNSPSNPTGHVMSEDEARALAKLADDTGILLISDEIYEDFVFDQAHYSPRQFTKNCLVMGGASKSMGIPGWRVGWMIGQREFIEQCFTLQQFSYVCAPAPAQWAALAGLDMDFTPYLDSYRNKRDKIYSGLHELYSMPRPGGSFFVFPKLPEGVQLGTFMDACIAQQLLVVPGSACSERATHFRISYAATDEKLDAAIHLLNNIAQELTG